MNLPQIQIKQQYAKIGMNIKKPQLNINQNKAKMNIKQPTAKLQIRQKNVNVKIDNYPHRYDLKMKNFTDIRKELKNKSIQKLMGGISRTARNGDRLMRIERKGNNIQQIAAEETFPPQKQLDLKLLRGPNFQVEANKLEIDAQEQKTIIKARVNKPNSNLNWGKVNVRMAQYNDINIYVKGGSVNTRI